MLDNSRHQWGCGAQELCTSLVGMENAATLETSLVVPQKVKHRIITGHSKSTRNCPLRRMKTYIPTQTHIHMFIAAWSVSRRDACRGPYEPHKCCLQQQCTFISKALEGSEIPGGGIIKITHKATIFSYLFKEFTLRKQNSLLPNQELSRRRGLNEQCWHILMGLGSHLCLPISLSLFLPPPLPQICFPKYHFIDFFHLTNLTHHSKSSQCRATTFPFLKRLCFCISNQSMHVGQNPKGKEEFMLEVFPWLPKSLGF